MPLVKDLYSNSDHGRVVGVHMQIGHDHQLIDGQLLVIVCLLEEILYRERIRSKL